MLEVVADPVDEARRYVTNAKDLLEKNGQLDYETLIYGDRKYVRMAGNTLWNGVLLILDAVFHIKSKDRPHPDIVDYKDAYETIHIAMGYDGNPGKEVSAQGIRLTNEIIDRCAAML